MSWKDSITDNVSAYFKFWVLILWLGKKCDLLLVIVTNSVLATKTLSFTSTLKILCLVTKENENITRQSFWIVVIGNYLSVWLRMFWYCATKSKYRTKLYIEIARGQHHNTYPQISNLESIWSYWTHWQIL